MLILFAAAVCVGLLAGVYPAFVLARFRPALVLKGVFRSSSKGVALRKADQTYLIVQRQPGNVYLGTTMPIMIIGTSAARTVFSAGTVRKAWPAQLLWGRRGDLRVERPPA